MSTRVVFAARPLDSFVKQLLSLVDDIAAQVRFEREARLQALAYERKAERGILRYRFAIEVPVHDDERLVTVEFARARPPAHASVRVDGPRCLRHRFNDDSLCMWLESDPPDKRWVPSEGLLELARHVELHAYCETECRAGRPWPKAESPGRHPRRRSCPTCHGRCSSQ